jgi:hypothetical protein
MLFINEATDTSDKGLLKSGCCGAGGTSAAMPKKSIWATGCAVQGDNKIAASQKVNMVATVFNTS